MPSFLRAVAEDIRNRFGSDLADLAIIFNNKRPITYLTKHLADVYGKAVWSPRFFTIQEFLKTSTTASEASALGRFFHLYELHNELLAAEGRQAEAPEEFYPVAEVILGDFGQLDYELADVDRMYAVLRDTTEIDITFRHFTEEQQQFIRQFWQTFSAEGHTGLQERFLRLWKRLPRLYRAFKARLERENQIDYPTLYRNLAEGRAESPAFADGYKKLLFVGFNALGKAEVSLFRNWQQQGRALFYFDTDRHYMDDERQEAGLFIRRNIRDCGLQNALGESPNTLADRRVEINLYAAAGTTGQAKLLHDILAQNEDPDRTSAVLLADESLLVGLLQSLPDDVRPNITTGYPLAQSPIYGLLDLWLHVQEDVSHLKRDKIPFSRLETFASHPMLQLSTEEKNALLAPFAERHLVDVDVRELSAKTSLLPDFFRRIDHPSELLPILVGMLEQLLDSLAGDDRMSLINSNLLVETKKTVLQLQLGMERIGTGSVAFQIGLLRKAILPIKAAIEGDPLRGLQIMGLLESRCLNFDNVYILGANEGILPQTSAAPTFLPNSLRRAHGLPVPENQDALSAYLFYRHLQYSSGIHVFYNSLVDADSTGEESRFLKQLQFESAFRFNIFVQQQPIRPPVPLPQVAVPKTGKVWEQLYGTFVRDKKRLSATALTTYLESPLRFFLQYVAGIPEPPRVSQEFETNRLGTVVHQVMETLLQPYKGLENVTETRELKGKLKAVDTLVAAEIGRQYQMDVRRAEDLSGMLRVMHRIAASYVRIFLQSDMERYRSFRIIELENDEDYILDFPVEIGGKAETVRLYGIIDRVDEVVGMDGRPAVRIVDYKTGSDRVVFTNLENVFGPNTGNKALVQTLFYTHIFEQVTGMRKLEPHLYAARSMREDGTLFSSTKNVLEGEALSEAKERFLDFLHQTLSEIFDPGIPFGHGSDRKARQYDRYTLFYGSEGSDVSDE